MDDIFNKTLRELEVAFEILENQVPRPIKKPYGRSFVFRYEEKSIYQALIQKLVRVVSGLHAAKCLLEKGFVQEIGVLQRIIDELDEDILFLVYGLSFGTITELHERYLEYFYDEEFDVPNDPLKSSQKRGMIPRKKIRAYIASTKISANDTSTEIELMRTLHKAYSGYVHGASPQIMDMYGGDPPRFYISGMLGTPRIQQYAKSLCNQYYRAILSFIMVAKVFGNKELAERLSSIETDFEKRYEEKYGTSIKKAN